MYKEIVTKAIIGKGRKSFKNSYDISTEEVPNTVLGCWIINHKFNGINNNDSVKVDGSFDLNIWYSYDNDTKTTVSTKNINYFEELNLRLKDSMDNTDIIVRSLKQPTVTDVSIKDGLVHLDIEKELGVEVVGDSKFRVMTDESEDDWEEIEDIDINEDYIK